MNIRSEYASDICHDRKSTFTRKKKIVQEGGEVTKFPKEVTLVITGKSSVKDEGEKLFGLTKSFLKKYRVCTRIRHGNDI